MLTLLVARPLAVPSGMASVPISPGAAGQHAAPASCEAADRCCDGPNPAVKSGAHLGGRGRLRLLACGWLGVEGLAENGVVSRAAGAHLLRALTTCNVGNDQWAHSSSLMAALQPLLQPFILHCAAETAQTEQKTDSTHHHQPQQQQPPPSQLLFTGLQCCALSRYIARFPGCVPADYRAVLTMGAVRWLARQPARRQMGAGAAGGGQAAVSSASSSSAAGGTTGGGRRGGTGTNQLAHALETRDDEVASASLLVQAMWKADGWQEGTLISTLTQVFQSAQNKVSRSHQGYALSHVLALVPSDTLVHWQGQGGKCIDWER